MTTLREQLIAEIDHLSESQHHSYPTIAIA